MANIIVQKVEIECTFNVTLVYRLRELAGKLNLGACLKHVQQFPPLVDDCTALSGAWMECAGGVGQTGIWWGE